MCEFDDDKAEILITLLEEFLGDHRKHYESKCQITFDCPNCSALNGVEYDGKGNLEVNYSLGVYHCWSCAETDNTKGKLYWLFKNFADNEIVRRFVVGKFTFTDDFYQTPIKEEKPIISLPEECFLLSGKQKYPNFKEAFGYLYSRGITDEIIDKFKIGYCIFGKYQNRVIIPSYDDNGNLNYFISRTISKHVKKFKYLNPQLDKTQIIFNSNLIDWDKPIYLVEGVFDHIVTPNSIPLLGKKMYNLLFNQLYFKSNNFIIIALDSDAYDDSVIIFNKLNAGRLRGKILLNLMPEDCDISTFNQIYGQDKLKDWLTNKNYILND